MANAICVVQHTLHGERKSKRRIIYTIFLERNITIILDLLTERVAPNREG